MHKIAASLVGAAAVGASLLVLRSPRPEHPADAEPEVISASKSVHAGETVPSEISLERLRELGL